jgi:hypothetical protein
VSEATAVAREAQRIQAEASQTAEEARRYGATLASSITISSSVKNSRSIKADCVKQITNYKALIEQSRVKMDRLERLVNLLEKNPELEQALQQALSGLVDAGL